MGILSIVSIFRLITVPIVILRNKICSSDITISLIELVVNYICYYLLISVPNMIYCLTVNSLFISQTACVILVACSRFTVSEADKLIQTVISISFSLTLSSFGNLVTVSIIGVNRLLNIAVQIKRIFFFFNSLDFLLQKCRVFALSVIVIVLSYIIFSTCCRHLGTVSIIVILV